MSVVHEAVRSLTVGRLRHHRARAVPLICCAAALLAGCGGNGDSKQRAGDRPLPTLPTPLRLAECSDWRKGNIEERRGTVIQIREFAGGPVGSSRGIQRGRVLDDAEAYQILDRYCSRGFARGFRLYALYTRAAAFTGHPQTIVPFERAPTPKNPPND
jgi:hypothetical protein